MSTEETKQVDPLDTPEVNKAAFNFMNIGKEMRRVAGDMSFRSLRRVFLAVQEYPFNTQSELLKDKEHELFLMCVTMADNKKIMLEALDKDDKLKKELEDKASSVVADELLTKASSKDKGDQDEVE
jgi:hypothetical protein